MPDPFPETPCPGQPLSRLEAGLRAPPQAAGPPEASSREQFKQVPSHWAGCAANPFPAGAGGIAATGRGAAARKIHAVWVITGRPVPLTARLCALAHHRLLAAVAGQGRGAFELPARLLAPAQPRQQVAAHGGQQVVVARLQARRPARRPGPGPRPRRWPCPPPPPPARHTCPAHRPVGAPVPARPGHGRSAGDPTRRDPGRAAGSVHHAHRCASAPAKAWMSISATNPCTSGSRGISPASTRPSRKASSHRPGRIQSSPAVAA
ncbi:hypothetical protein RLIN73S_00830 [Rhodanobacter lindaniclasticus]